MRLSIGQKLTLAFAVAVGILFATGLVALRSTASLVRTTDELSHTHAVLTALDGVTGLTSEAEARARAYVVSGDSTDASGYHSAVAGVRRHLSTLGTLAANDSVQRLQVASLAPLVGAQLLYFDTLMAARRRIGFDSLARTSASDDAGVMPSLGAAGVSIRAREKGTLQARSQLARASASRAARVVAFGMLLVFVLAPLAYFMARNDLFVRRDSERALRESEARFRAAADGALDAFYVLRSIRDGAGKIVDFEFVDLNARASTLLGRARADILHQRLCELIPINRTGGFFDKYVHVMESGIAMEEEFEITSPEVQAAWIHHQVVPLDDGVAITSRDISKRKRQEEALRALSLVDELTGLYNRRGFLTLAQQQLKLARRGRRELLLLFVDMDDFKDINDSFGHPEGDGALIRAAQILRKTFRDSDIIARMGGDEFVVLAADIGARSSEIIITRLRAELRERNEHDGYPYRLSFSVGVARFDPDAPPSVEELLAAADTMLYENKKHKRQTEMAAG